MESANHEKNLEIGLVCQTEWTVAWYEVPTINTLSFILHTGPEQDLR